MKRIILSAIIMVMAAMAVVSCSNNRQKDAAANETTEMENTQNTELQYDIVTTH